MKGSTLQQRTMLATVKDEVHAASLAYGNCPTGAISDVLRELLNAVEGLADITQSLIENTEHTGSGYGV